ncbi:MAG: hypothetical protein HPY51_15650 [Candidatus Omnitrophica bacterium]|nr:hypothetical protein [Candidatus Omnitrophota bacterium]
MNHPLLLLSYPQPSNGNSGHWFATVSKWLQALRHLHREAALEFCPTLPKQGQSLPEQPTIEEIDFLLQKAGEAGCRFGSIYIPVDLAKSDEGLGEEISRVDGWIDLASYAEFRAARLSLEHPETLAQPGPRRILENIIEYMDDMDLQAILFISGSSLAWGSEFLNQYQKKLKHPLGLGLPWEAAVRRSVSDLHLRQVTAVSLDVPLPLDMPGIERQVLEIESLFGDVQPILVVCPREGEKDS